jgi:hypothetical protein
VVIEFVPMATQKDQEMISPCWGHIEVLRACMDEKLLKPQNDESTIEIAGCHGVLPLTSNEP